MGLDYITVVSTDDICVLRLIKSYRQFKWYNIIIYVFDMAILGPLYEYCLFSQSVPSSMRSCWIILLFVE